MTESGERLYRMSPEEAGRIVEEEWAPHEAKMYREAKLQPASPPRWVTEVAEHPDGGPSDTAYARLNRNRPKDAALDRDPAAELEKINAQLASDEFRFAPAEGDGLPSYPKQADPSLVSLWRRSEMRTPLIVPASMLQSQSAAVDGIKGLAQTRETDIIVLQQSSATEQEVDTALQTALNEGRWVVIIREKVDTAPHGEMPGWFIFRRVALQCLTVTPQPDQFPKRELFRLWVVVPDPVDLNDTNYPAFPTLFSHQALQLCPTDSSDSNKVVRKLPADPQLLEDEYGHRQRRVAQGRDEDGESLEGEVIENSCSPRKITGPLFVRSREMATHTSPQRERSRLGCIGNGL